MNTRRTAVAAVIGPLVTMLLAASAMAQGNSPNGHNGVDRLPGSWRVEITTPHQGSFPALFTFTGDGALIGTESPGPFESPSHGNWVGHGREAAYTFLVLFGSPAGAGRNTGSAKVVGTLQFDAGRGGWSGPFRIEVFDPAGHVLFSDRGTLQLTRIAIEALD